MTGDPTDHQREVLLFTPDTCAGEIVEALLALAEEDDSDGQCPFGPAIAH